MHVSWNEFKDIASNDVEANGAFIYRGQSDAAWSLVSSVFRTDIVKNISDVIDYINIILPQVHEPVEAWQGQRWDLTDYHGLAEFLAYLQHNGFPTPLLDFSMSPYIATYFAFTNVNHFNPESDKVAIYRFNRELWTEKFSKKTDIADTEPNVSILMPYLRGNHKLALQQGLFLWSNIADIKDYIESKEESNGQYLTKYTIDVTERPRVIKELSLMGISEVQLNPSIESVCKKALEDIIGLIPMNSKRG